MAAFYEAADIFFGTGFKKSNFSRPDNEMKRFSDVGTSFEMAEQLC